MNLNFSFREANKKDIDEILILEGLCFPADPWSRDMYEMELDNPLIRYYLAELDDEDKLIGYIGFLTVGDECQINNVAVHPDYQRYGIASEMLELAINITSDEEVSTWTLEVRKGNEPAISLYEKYGFKMVGERKDYYEDGEAAVLMTREVIAALGEDDDYPEN